VSLYGTDAIRSAFAKDGTDPRPPRPEAQAKK
jgi:hypothetical protein